MSTTCPISPVDRAALWRARVEWMGKQPWTVALTLSYNSVMVSKDRIRHDLRAMHSFVDRQLLGTRFNKKPASQRTNFIAVVEDMDHHPHIHLALSFPPGQWFQGGRLCQIVWKKLSVRGSSKATPIDQGNDGWVAYMVKKFSADDIWISSDDFLSGQSLAAA